MIGSHHSVSTGGGFNQPQIENIWGKKSQKVPKTKTWIVHTLETICIAVAFRGHKWRWFKVHGGFSWRWRWRRRRKPLPLLKLKPKQRLWRPRKQCWKVSTAAKKKNKIRTSPTFRRPKTLRFRRQPKYPRKSAPGETNLTTMLSSNSPSPPGQPRRN